MHEPAREPFDALQTLRAGPSGASELMPALYDELRRLAGAYLRGQPADHTLQPTALVHEAFLRMVDQQEADFNDRAHFFAVAATVMRRLLVNHAEKRASLKRGGDRLKLTLDERRDGDAADDVAAEVLALHEALEELAQLDPRKGRVVELRWFGGMTHGQIADVLGVSRRTVDADWQLARAWLSEALDDDGGGPLTPEEFQRVERLFQRAVAMPAAERTRYLDEACDETHIRTRVEVLLARDADPHRLLAFDPAEPAPAADHPVPKQVGPYRILDLLGEGAMGVVYRAEQENPRRVVALKLMRAGFSGPQALRRFRREAELLGRLKHPGVAHVIEAGTTSPAGEGGPAQPYFVMELVDGAPLIEHVQRNELTVRARVELMVRICEAVEHAHLSGIVHRDLKPANILVTDHGTESSRSTRDASPVGQPKVLDFGVARIMHDDQRAATVQTSAGEIIGTLPYMSPEQISGDRDAVDTRCDVYALGVILYEMLAGRRPHDLAGRSLAEAVRIVCHDAPTPLRAVDRHLRGDLDTIVATAMEKDVERRYASVAMLAGDLRRYLADEPILARAPTTLYQLRKFARRNRGLVAGVVTTLVVLAAGLLVSAVLYAKAETRAESMRRALYAQRITLGQNAIESADVRQVAALLEACPSDLRHWEWGRLRLLADRSERTLRGHRAHVNRAVFTPDGRFVITAGGYDEMTPPATRDATLRIWDAAGGSAVRVIEGHGNSVDSLALSPDGRTLATMTRTRGDRREEREGSLRLWDVERGEMIGELATHPENAWGLAFSADGRALFVGGGLGVIAKVDVATREVLWASPSSALTSSVALAPDGRSVVTAEWSGMISVWDAATGDLRWSRRPHGVMVVRAVAVSRDGRLIATASKDRTVRLLDLETGDDVLALPDVGALVSTVAFGPDGRVYSGAADGVIRAYDPRTGVLQSEMLGHEGFVSSLAWTRDGARLVSASHDGTVRLWRPDAEPVDVVRKPHGENEVNEVAWNREGTRVVTAGDDGHARVTDARSGAEVLALLHGDSYVHAVDWSRDGTRIATLESKGTVRLWDAQTGHRLAEWRGAEALSITVAFSPDGRFVATGGRGHLRIWGGQTGALVRDLAPGSADVTRLEWSPDGAMVATADSAGVVTLRSAADGAVRSAWTTPAPYLTSLAFHPHRAWIAAGDGDGTVRVWDWRAERPVYAARAHTDWCEWIAFSPDGARMLTSGRDGLVRLLESSSGRQVMTLKAHRFGVKSAVFSPDGTRIASTSRDATLRIWNAAPIE